MTTHYHSDSKGLVEIASMNIRHAQNALAKLQRSDNAADRHSEIQALTDHIAKLEAEYAAQQAAEDAQ